MNQQAVQKLLEELLAVLSRHLGEDSSDRPAVIPLKQWLNNIEAAAELGVKPQTLAQWRYRRKGPKVYRSGAKIRYKMSDLIAWMDKNADDGREAA